jgi:predicted ATPase
MVNPFRPTFGVTPPLLVGRDAEILAFGDALDQGPGAPGRATLYTGVRGIGKTAMLNEAEGQARQRGWVTVSETAVSRPG